MSTVDKVVVSVYFALTTLSTVGYGDYYPISILEKILGSILMFCGVTFFSIMMNGFIEIIMSLKGESGDKNEKALDKWFLLIRRFKRRFFTHDISKTLHDDIEEHFKYFWLNHRSATLVEQKEYFDSLPRDIRTTLMTDYLYNDIFTKQKIFKSFLSLGQRMDSSFLYDLSFGFLPRQFLNTERDRYIYEQNQDVNEMYFLISGSWAICFYAGGDPNDRQFNETDDDDTPEDVILKGLIKAKSHSKPNYIGDYYCINSKKPKYYYMAW
eukprot:CAMPEP_0170548802 /NCGR_PEP_ID=MMETSP0211-20121228/6991_1 /TAXON_ID=311385 /ORGANISM="Pseudokeronopsis sp., Strain OXSARD2" /LENGTH=267 /DNA_ID=CAMNT_0010854443 /DNA_START=853 /DNA_END=1653 /DNA_ORIENTATION=-